MLRRYIPQSCHQLGFVIVACVFFYAAFRVAFPIADSGQNTIAEGRSGEGSAFASGLGKGCDGATSNGRWQEGFASKCTAAALNVANCGEDFSKTWQWHDRAAKCGVKRLSPSELSGVLKDRWVAVVGDSIGRMLFAALLRFLGGSGDYPIKKAHQNFEYTLPEDLKASFFWAPFPNNASDLLFSWAGQGIKPDVMLLSVGLWHMLHVDSQEAFGKDLKELGSAVRAVQELPDAGDSEKGQRREVQMFMCSITDVQPAKLLTEQKKQHMTPANVKAYNEALTQSRLLHPDGLLELVHAYSITAGCGEECSEDGIHYHNATYDAILQTWVNQIVLLQP